MIDDLINEILAWIHGNQRKRMMMTKGKGSTETRWIGRRADATLVVVCVCRAFLRLIRIIVYVCLRIYLYAPIFLCGFCWL